MKADTKIVIYTGRFQVFGRHHYQVYRSLCDKFGKNNVFITTTNSTHDVEKNPLNYKEKLSVILKYGIPKTQICCVSSTYKSTELTDHFNPNTVAAIFVYGEKDAGRIQYIKSDGSPSYFKPYSGQLEIEPFSKSGYVLVVPHKSVEVNGEELNGTLLRKLLPNSTESEFTELMGWYDPQIHAMFKRKFKSEIDYVAESIANSLSEGNTITKTQLQRIEQYADRLFKEFGIDIEFQNLYAGTHFFQRLNDPRNGTPISTDELRNLFRKVSVKYGDKLAGLSPNSEGVLRDMESDINMPFIIKFDRDKKELDLIPKTIMRKPDFKSVTKFYAVENVQPYTRHIIHPFEDENLTFAALSEMIEVMCNSPQDIPATLKLDGQNAQFTSIAGEVRISRNKSTILTPMTRVELIDLMQTKPDAVLKSFVDAFDVVSNWINEQDLHSQFNEGRTFLNTEICNPSTQNVINYGNSRKIYVHGLIDYDESGNIVKKYSPNFQYSDDVLSTPTIKLKPCEGSEKLLDELYKMIVKCNLTVAHPVTALRNDDDFQCLIFKFGNCVIRANSNGQTNHIISKLSKIDDQIAYAEEDVKTRFLKNMQKFNKLNQVVNPIEGIVFTWKNGKQYKLTGSFSVINQILGLFRYAR